MLDLKWLLLRPYLVGIDGSDKIVFFCKPFRFA